MRRSGRISFFQKLTATFDRLPIRVRLAGVSALLTFVILCGFAVAVGSLTVRRIRSDFNSQVAETASQLPSQLSIKVNPSTFQIVGIDPPLQDLAEPEGSAVIRILALGGAVIAETSKAPSLGPASLQPRNVDGYRVLSHPADVYIASTGERVGQVYVQYGRSVSDTEATVTRVELFLLIGVLVGTGLALFAGMMIARRAMAPIARLTSAAAEIARTRDPSRVVPQSEADDEVSELARTLEGMLRELDAARGETEAMLVRQRRFVADASHELRTPLTSVLVNLELLAESLHGDQGEAARSALRSSQRMRRLVADLLLLARTDVGRVVPHEPCALDQIVVEAASELGAVSGAHEISLDVGQSGPVFVEGSRDELHRLTINLLENALRHTPAGTEIRVSTRLANGEVLLVVEDEGPGVPEHLRETLFERFVRGAGDRGGSFGLGLAIVRAVAETHGGSVSIEPTGERDGATYGARFTVRLPAARAVEIEETAPSTHPVADPAV
ncbi:MAG TPA: HAMP domain-containing sensor histidine kinase [Solirubrobacteraceae bacterium]|jgi:signal transduction histidine kinase